MNRSERTKHLTVAAWFFSIISFILTWGPILIYTAMAYQSATATVVDKVTLTSLLSVGVIMSIVCLINKYTLRCRTWLVLIGLWLCLDKVLGCILVIAITQCVDEIIVQPIAKSYRHKLTINKEIDKRA